MLMTLLPLLCAGGCIAVPLTQPRAPYKLPAGSTYLLHVPGISGMLVVDGWLVDGLHDGGAADLTEVFDWVGPGNIIQVLRDVDRNRQAARRMAPSLAEWRRLNPDSKIILCSESGGVAVALWLLESLPPGVAVDDFLMVSPAVSRDYDLTAALSHVKHRAYYTTTPIDVDTLGLFTLIFGNGDGPRGIGAGWLGFEQTHPNDKLLRVPFQAAVDHLRELRDAYRADVLRLCPKRACADAQGRSNSAATYNSTIRPVCALWRSASMISSPVTASLAVTRFGRWPFSMQLTIYRISPT